MLHVRIQRGDRGSGPPPPPLINHKNIGFLSTTGSDPLKHLQNYQASTQCWANIGLPAKRHLNVAFRWWSDNGPLLVLFGSSLFPSPTKKTCQNWTTSDKTFCIRARHLLATSPLVRSMASLFCFSRLRLTTEF